MKEVHWQPWREYERSAQIVFGNASDIWFLVLRAAEDHALVLRLKADTVHGKAVWDDHERPKVWDVALHARWTTEEAGTTCLQSCDYLEGGLCFIVRYECAAAGQIWTEAPADFDDLDMTPERLLALDGVWGKMAEMYTQWLAYELPKKRIACPHCDGKGLVKP